MTVGLPAHFTTDLPHGGPILATSKRIRFMLFSSFAVQPTAWQSFDEHACQWATDIHHAYRLGQAWDEPCMIWAVPHNGNAYRWCRCDENTNAIADTVFGR